MSTDPVNRRVTKLVGGRIGGRYLVERLVRTAPVSSLFRAQDTDLQRRVLLQVFHPEHPDDVALIEQHLQHAMAIARLAHPHIGTVIDRGSHEGLQFVVLEHVRGESLQERIDKYAPLTVDEVLGYVRHVCKALAHAHAHGIAHGNVRPENMLITEDRNVKLVDFGSQSTESILLSDPYRLLGRMGGAPAIDIEDDLYAVGVMAFHALTETFPGTQVTQAQVRLLRPDVGPPFAAVIQQLLEVAHGRGYATVRDVLQDLPQPAKRHREYDDDAAASGVGDDVVPTPSLPESAGGSGVGAETSSAIHVFEIDTSLPSRHVPSAASGVGKRPRSRRARIIVGTAVVLPLCVAAIIVALISGEQSSTQKRITPNGEITGPLVPLEIVGSGAFDPFGSDVPPGENDADVPNLLDGDSVTTWQTEGYEAQFGTGTFKSGVGVWFELAEPAAVKRISIISDLPGWAFEVRAARSPQQSLNHWTVVSSRTFTQRELSTAQVDTDTQKYRSYLIWINRLAIAPDGKYRARMGSVAVRGVQ